MNNIKIAFFDIDGTLSDMKTKKISEKTIYMLKELQKKGIMICIASGRGPMTLPKFEGVQFDAYVLFNGAYCYNEKERIYSNPISNEDIKILLENAKKMNRPVAIASSERLVANGKDADLVEYFSFAKLELEVSENFEEVSSEEIYQVMLSCREEEYGAILKNTENAKIASWWERAADVIPVAGGKGNGIRKTLEYYGIDKEDAIAFGDGNNDVEMFEAVGTAVAMGNASAELKELATDMCGHVSEDGIYHYCVEQQLIPELKS